jgi:hypothetical protein
MIDGRTGLPGALHPGMLDEMVCLAAAGAAVFTVVWLIWYRSARAITVSPGGRPCCRPLDRSAGKDRLAICGTNREWLRLDVLWFNSASTRRSGRTREGNSPGSAGAPLEVAFEGPWNKQRDSAVPWNLFLPQLMLYYNHYYHA